MVFFWGGGETTNGFAEFHVELRRGGEKGRGGEKKRVYFHFAGKGGEEVVFLSFKEEQQKPGVTLRRRRRRRRRKIALTKDGFPYTHTLPFFFAKKRGFSSFYRPYFAAAISPFFAAEKREECRLIRLLKPWRKLTSLFFLRGKLVLAVIKETMFFFINDFFISGFLTLQGFTISIVIIIVL